MRLLRGDALVRIGGLLVGLVAAACTGSSQEPPADGDGSTEWELVRAEFSVGGPTNDERYTLSRVVGATRLPDGRVVIADHYVQGLRLYDSSGRYLTSVGGAGQGPGEYRFILGLGRCQAGRVVAFDRDWHQKVYLEDLTLVEEQGSRVPGLGGPPYAFACAPSGYAVGTGWGDSQSQFTPGYFVATAPVVLVRDGQVAHAFGERLSSERIGTLRSNGLPAGSGPHPFGRRTSVAIGRDLVFLGDGSEYSVEVYDLRGDPVRTVSWEGPSRRIEERHYDAYGQTQLEAADEDRQPAVRRRLAALPRLEQFPAYDELLASGTDELWVRLFPRPGDDQVEWRVFDPSGSPLGFVRVTQEWEILEIGEDYVLAVETDSLGLETVRVASVNR